MLKKRSMHVVGMVVAFILTGLLIGVQLDTPASGAPSSVVSSESSDFATHVLRDPWDMSEFSDISQYLNQSGQAIYLLNPLVQNGIFSAQSNGTANFFVLFPGYLTAIKTGKVGARYPISAATYHCIYIAMNVQSSGTGAQVFWFADDRLNGPGGTWGAANPFSVSASVWKLYALDLATYPTATGTAWTGSPTGQWQGLRIDPTHQAGVNFSVDWVRLTDCTAVTTTINWASNPSVSSIWLISASTGNSILIKEGINGSLGAATLDTQGLAAGTYQVCLSSSITSCNSVAAPTPSSLIINQVPIAVFNRPSFTSGTDYATQAGNTWDFNDTADATLILNAAFSFSNGLLNLTTASVAPGGADPIIYLNTPQQIANGSLYRYLTFRMYTQWPWQNVPNGMVVRWIWSIPGGCELVSNDIPFDVGWQTYTVDLSDPFNGSVEQTGGSCPPGPLSWSTSGPIVRLRFDPNENALGASLFQQLDWIRLTQVDRVTHGIPFPIQISLNKPAQGISFNFYYTDNLQSPTQHAASTYIPPSPSPAPYHLYLPMAFQSFGSSDLPPVVNGVTFTWDTTSVTPNTSSGYYICVTANDGYNQATYCSEAPVLVY